MADTKIMRTRPDGLLEPATPTPGDLSARLPSMEALTAKLGTDDPVFAQWRDSVPDKNWAMKDLSALRIGYELGKSVAALSALPAAGGLFALECPHQWVPDADVAGWVYCPLCDVSRLATPPPDPAVGAQGDGGSQFGPVTDAELGEPDPIPRNLLTAPAAGKGVDANCWSADNGDTWLDCPDDAEFVHGLKVGDEYELQASVYSWAERFRVTKVPDDANDDYEIERVSPPVLTRQPVAGDGE